MKDVKKKKNPMMFKGRLFKAVPCPEAVCDGCIFEYSQTGRECVNMDRPSCDANERADGRHVVFQFRRMGRRAHGDN